MPRATDNAPFNLAIVKHIALNVLRTAKPKLPAHATQSRRLHENALAAYIAA